MGKLADFLNRQAEIQRSREGSTLALREAWVSEANRIVDRIRDWLREADPNGVLDLEEGEEILYEEGLGRYGVKTLTARLGAREVRVVPVARFVSAYLGKGLGGEILGRIDLTDGVRRHSLYRVADASPAPRWFIRFDGVHAREFSREALEDAVEDLLA